jgi:hypothetical protein
MNYQKNDNHLTPWELVLVIATALAFLISFVLIIHTFHTLSRNGSLNPIYHPHQQHLHRQLQVGNVMGWMTFDYINRSFSLPADYLKTKLNITDKKYPNISLNTWAKESNQVPNKVIEDVKTAVDEYLNPPILNGKVNSI